MQHTRKYYITMHEAHRLLLKNHVYHLSGIAFGGIVFIGLLIIALVVFILMRKYVYFLTVLIPKINLLQTQANILGWVPIWS